MAFSAKFANDLPNLKTVIAFDLDALPFQFADIIR